MRIYPGIVLALALAACSGGGGSPPVVGQWANGGGKGEPTIANGAFSFPGPGGYAGYVYTQLPNVPKIGQTLTLNYSIAANNPIWAQLPASGGNSQTDINPPTMHLFLWRKGDTMTCANEYNWYRQFAARTELVAGDKQVISAKLDPTLWTGCYGSGDVNAFQALLSNLYGAGFTFGGQWFAGHGIFLSGGSAAFKVNSFMAQ